MTISSERLLPCPFCRPGDGVDYDHETPLIDGGRHAESNLRAVHRKCHRLLTARQAQTRAEERSQFRAVYGIKRSGNGFATNRTGKWKKRMDGTVVRRGEADGTLVQRNLKDGR